MNPAIKEVPLPKYIAIEGPIGVGKTTLANKIAETFNYDSFLEHFFNKEGHNNAAIRKPGVIDC